MYPPDEDFSSEQERLSTSGWRVLQKENLKMAPLKRETARPASKVEGPIRCHTCNLVCGDAEHYLSHTCEPKPSPVCLAFPSASLRSPLHW